MRTILPALLALVLSPTAAHADGPISTAPASQAPPAGSPAPPLQASGDQDADAGSAVRMGPCGPQRVGADGVPETKPHGYAEVGVGTRGYRHVALGVCKPLRDGGAVAISVSQTEAQGTAGRR